MIRFAIIGTGKITHTFMQAALKAPGFHLEAVYSRTEEKGRAFASAYGVDKVYTSLDALGRDDAVDAVYIASPNSSHWSQAVLMADYGKHVLCEKPIAASVQELRCMMEAADRNNIILLEAMRPVYDPGFAKIRELLPRLGQVRRAVFQYCQYSSRYDAFKKGIIENAFNPALSNAALMDIGVYCIHPMVVLFGRPERITASGIFLHNHMEGAGTVLMDYGHMLGEARYSKITDSKEPSEIQGEDASVLIWQIQDTKRIEVRGRDGSVECFEIAKEDNNMYYEIIRFMELASAAGGSGPEAELRCGPAAERGRGSAAERARELAADYLAGSVMELEVMDQVRELTGIRFQ